MDDVSDTMWQIVNKTIERGEKLDDLEGRIEKLEASVS